MRVLVADDDIFSRKILVDLLQKQGYETSVASDGVEAWQAIEKLQGPTVLMITPRLPKTDGIEICRKLKEREGSPEIFSIFLTPPARRDEVFKALETSGDDMMAKPVDPQELRVRLRLAKRIVDLETALRQEQTRDPLTGLCNRAAIADVLRQEIARARRKNEPVAIILSNIDGFKLVNNSYGHFAGDAVLCEVAKRFRATMRAYDTIGRYGGSELLIVIPSCGILPAAQQGVRLRAAVSRKDIETTQRKVPATVCLGVAASDQVRDADADAVLRAAERALRRAKDVGRDHAEVATAQDFASEDSRAGL